MKEWTIEEWKHATQKANIAAYYLYTPMCGTCQVASKMLEVVEELLPHVELGKANLNYVETLAVEQEIESVPCLLIAKDGQIQEKIYAFHSVTYLYDKLRKSI